MERILKIIKIVTLGIVVMVLGGLVGLFVFLQSKQNTIKKTTQLQGGAQSSLTDSTPFGSVLENSSTTRTTPYTASTSTHAIQRVWHIDEQPVAGMGFASSSLLYVVRANGYVMQADINTQNTSRLTDTLMPKIYSAYIAQDGGVAERSIDTSGTITLFTGAVATSSPTVADATTSTQVIFTGSYITPNIDQLALNTKTKQLLSVQPSGQYNSVVSLQPWDGSKGKLLATMPTKGWLPLITKDGRMFLTQRPADGIEGYTYSLSASGVLTPFVRNIPGLITLPQPNGKGYLYSQSSGGGLSITLVATSTGLVIPLQTIADKCVWALSEIAVYCAVPKSITTRSFINDWYRGVIHTQDEWWKIDTSTSTRIYDPAGDNISFDVEDPTIDPSGSYLIFRDRTDESLWALRVAQ